MGSQEINVDSGLRKVIAKQIKREDDWSQRHENPNRSGASAEGLYGSGIHSGLY